MSNPLVLLSDFITGVAPSAVSVIGAVNQTKTTQTQLKLQELATREAEAKKEAAQSAAANASKFFSSKTAENIVIWTVTTIAGGILVSVVLKLAGFRK
jgi:hypothetical protein